MSNTPNLDALKISVSRLNGLLEDPQGLDSSLAWYCLGDSGVLAKPKSIRETT